jgi:hypothetical protein
MGGGRVMEGVEWAKVKYITVGIHLNIDLDINNEIQNCKIGTVLGGGREGERRRLR